MSKQQNNYVSELDQLLTEFDQQHPELSESQQKEVRKHQRIQRLRDQAEAGKETTPIWERF
jgi:hypothetical protein